MCFNFRMVIIYRWVITNITHIMYVILFAMYCDHLYEFMELYFVCAICPLYSIPSMITQVPTVLIIIINHNKMMKKNQITSLWQQHILTVISYRNWKKSTFHTVSHCADTTRN